MPDVPFSLIKTKDPKTKETIYTMTVGDKSFPLHPWIGVQLEYWSGNPRDWSNEKFSKNPNDDVRDLRNRFVGPKIKAKNYLIQSANVPKDFRGN